MGTYSSLICQYGVTEDRVQFTAWLRLLHLIVLDRAISESAIIRTGQLMELPPHPPHPTKPHPGSALLCAMNFKGPQE